MSNKLDEAKSVLLEAMKNISDWERVSIPKTAQFIPSEYVVKFRHKPTRFNLEIDFLFKTANDCKELYDLAICFIDDFHKVEENQKYQQIIDNLKGETQ